jgi:aflatoxin B1 aldehyde reductase
MCCRLCIRGGGFNPVARGRGGGAVFRRCGSWASPFTRSVRWAGEEGYFSKSVEELRVPPKGTRMDEMSAFQEIDVSDARIRLLESLREACDRHGMAVKEATLRWFMHHSALGGTRTG